MARTASRKKPTIAPLAPVVSAQIGSNMPPAPKPLSPQEVRAWLDAEYSTLAARRDEMVNALEATLKATPVIKSAEQLGVFIENIKTAKEIDKLTALAFAAAKAPFTAGGKAVDAWKWSILDPISAVIKKMQPVMDTWGLAEEKRKREEAQAEQARLQKIAEEQAAAAMAAETEAEQEAAYSDLASTAARQEKAAKQVTATPAALTRTRGDFGAVGSMRTTWKWRLTDITQVPAEFLTVNEDAIKAALSERDPQTRKPLRTIPGIEVYADRGMQVR